MAAVKAQELAQALAKEKEAAGFFETQPINPAVHEDGSYLVMRCADDVRTIIRIYPGHNLEFDEANNEARFLSQQRVRMMRSLLANDTVTPHHFVNLSGHMPTYKYRFGGDAGMRPPGGADGKFGTTIEPPQLDRAEKGRRGWMFYSYWHEMRSWQTPHGAADGRPNAYYGNNFLADGQRPFVGRETWICVEMMVQLNRIGEHDGEQAVWIDGNHVGHWGPGFPEGSWIRDRFVTSGSWNKKPGPFAGFSWRTDERLRINRAMLQWYVSDRAAKRGSADQNIVYFDNLVIATQYIGPLAEKHSNR